MRARRRILEMGRSDAMRGPTRYGMAVPLLWPVLLAACSPELGLSADLEADARLAVLPAEASVVFRLAPGRFAEELAEIGLGGAAELREASAVGGCADAGCVVLVEASAALLSVGAGSRAVVPARLDSHAPDGRPLVWRVLGPGKAVFGDAAAVEAAWQRVRTDAPGFDAARHADDVPAGESWLLVADPEAFGELAAARLDGLATPQGQVVSDTIFRLDQFWPGLRGRAASFASSFDDESGLVRVRLRAHDAASAVALEAEARARAAFSPVAVSGVERVGLHVELRFELGELP